MVPLKTEWLGKKKWKQHEGYYRDYYCLLGVYLRLGTWNKTRKIRFSAKVDF